MSTLCNVVSTPSNVLLTLFQRRDPTLYHRWVTLKNRLRILLFFNVGSTLFQRWFTKLKQRWSGVEMLAGLHVNVITQSTLSHILTFTYFSRVKVCFWNFQEDSQYRWFLLIYLDDLLFTLTEAAWVRRDGGTFSLNLSN